ncbi:hypothetical protein HYV30_03985 [Candidatus Kaiserbacteria bacterium]|nr:hypothetical protein [Candidatus Kaiserbacteria bacterium]
MLLFLQGLLLILLLCVSLAMLFVYSAVLIGFFTTHAPFVPIPRPVIAQIVRNLQLANGSVLYDLGCGDGRVLKTAADTHAGIRAIGVEKAIIPYLLAKFKTRKYGNIQIRREDFFQTDLSDATHIYMYLFPKPTTQLLRKIKTECRPGTRVVSCDFRSEADTPVETVHLGRTKHVLGRELFVYQT